MINATTNDPTKNNSVGNEPVKTGVGGSPVGSGVSQNPSPAETPAKPPIFDPGVNKSVTQDKKDSEPAPVFSKPKTSTNNNMRPNLVDAPPGFDQDSDSSDKESKKPKLKNKFNVKMIAGVFALLLILVGAGAGFFLSQQSQDLRQQASEGAYSDYGTSLLCATACTGTCGGDSGSICYLDEVVDLEEENDGDDDGGGRKRCSAGTRLNRTSNKCEPRNDGGSATDPDPSRTGEYGECTADAAACAKELAKNENDPADPDVQIRGTYVSCESETCQRFVIDLPATHAAAVDYAVTYGDNLNLKDPNGSGKSIELAPYKYCNTNGVVGYGEYDCSSDHDGDGKIVKICPEGATNLGDGCYFVYYLGPNDYHTITENGETWVSSATGCGDGVHDSNNPGSSNYTPNSSDSDFPGDCDTWHWTTCLDEGSGVNGWGCGEDNSHHGEGTPPPVTPTPTPTPPITTEPICRDIAILDQQDNVLDPNATSFSIGMTLKFQCSADYAVPLKGAPEGFYDDNTITHYEFKIAEPDGNIITGDAINPTGSATISKEYTINQYLDHEVQCRICTANGCQNWLSVIPAPRTR